jgi:cell division septation protein DedD
MSNERSRDFGGAPSHGADQGGADRRDPGAEALLELARLIGGQNDPFAPEGSKAEPRPSDQRLGDVSRAASSLADAGRDPFVRSQDRPFERGSPGRREPDLAADLDAAMGRPGAEPSRLARAGGFDFPEPDRGGYPNTPRQSAVDANGGDRMAYRRRRDEHSDEYADGGEYGEPDEYGEDESETPRRRPTKAIMAVLGLAVFGSAAAYGYRTIVSAPSGPPPIIKADNSPSKITPMSDVRADGGRTGDRIGGERMLRRDEDPLDVGTGGAASGAVPATGGPATLPGDPRRVQTVPIRADQGTASSPDRPAPTRAVAPQVQAQVQPPPAASPAPRQLAAVQAPASPPPLQRQAAAAPAASAPPDAALAAPGESGGFVLQLLAVRSETDAQAEFRRLQTKYSSVLAGRQPLIRRKDRGDQGVFFVAQVGPFGAKSDADQLCDALKTAGGTCYVYKN